MGGFTKPPVQKQTEAAPTKDLAAEKQQKDLDALARRNASGRKSTILTSGQGLNDIVTVARKTLLGE